MNGHDALLPAGDGQFPPAAAPPSPQPPPPQIPVAGPPPPQSPPPQSQAAQAPASQPAPADLGQLADLVCERLAGRLGQPRPEQQRPEQPGELPAVDEAVALRERAPELYDLWLKIAQDRAATADYVRRAPYEVPERLAQSGRPRAVSSLVVVLAFCGYLAWLGGPGPYLAGLIAVFDLIVMLGLFFGLRPEHLSGTRRPGRRPLPGTDSERPGPAVPGPGGSACPGARCGSGGLPRPTGRGSGWVRPGAPVWSRAGGQATRRRFPDFSMVTASSVYLR